MILYTSLRNSLIKFCNDFAAEMKTIGLTADMKFFDFDAHAITETLPDNDLLGLIGFSLPSIEAKKPVPVSLGLGVSTFTDASMSRHHKIVGLLAKRLEPLQQVTIYDAETASEVGWLVIADGTEVNPVARIATRPVQVVGLNGLSNFSL